MKRLFIAGISGKMGKVVNANAADFGYNVVGGLSRQSGRGIVSNIHDIDYRVDAIIDFSSPQVYDDILDFALARRIPTVIATTGLSEKQLCRLETAAQSIPLLYSANMSMGVASLMKTLPILCKFADTADIVEMHHATKRDSPSGTAKSIADTIVHSGVAPNIHAIRGGNVIGSHKIIFANSDEVITIQHHALSRNIFAVGALKALDFIYTKPPHLYTMRDLMD